MRVFLNGEEREVPEGATIRALVLLVGAHPDAVAVAVDGTVVPRRQHGEVTVGEGSRVEVIRAVGGG